MSDRMPIIDVCANPKAHEEEPMFYLNGRVFYVLNIILPYTNTEELEGVFFSMPRPELVHELMAYRRTLEVVVRHTLCQSCQNDVQLEIASVIRDSSRF